MGVPVEPKAILRLCLRLTHHFHLATVFADAQRADVSLLNKCGEPEDDPRLLVKSLPARAAVAHAAGTVGRRGGGNQDGRRSEVRRGQPLAARQVWPASCRREQRQRKQYRVGGQRQRKQQPIKDDC